MQLADFLEAAHQQILEEAVAFAKTIPALQNTDERALRDHLPQVLRAIAADLRSAQSKAESIAKSQGLAPDDPSQSSAETHGLTRARDGINVEQLVAEFRALRSSILRLWTEAHPLGRDAIVDIMRFNEAIDQAVAESVEFHANERERWRQLFLGMLGHDLRSPLHAIAITVETMRKQELAPIKQVALLGRGVSRMTSLLDSLLEYSRARLGAGMALQRERVDLGHACAEELELQRAANPDARIDYAVQGDTEGSFDASRVREGAANLVANAIKHGTTDAPVSVRVVGTPDVVRISVENRGDLPNDQIEPLFEPLRRRDESEALPSHTHLGLGLFIVRQIARAHGGEVTGTCTDGRVRFTLELPKAAGDAPASSHT